MSRVVLGVAGGIAAYKACELLRRLQREGHDVTVVPTAAALEFVGTATWAALSGRPVHTTVFADAHLVPHVKLGQEADLVVVAPGPPSWRPWPRPCWPTPGWPGGRPSGTWPASPWQSASAEPASTWPPR